LVLLTLGALVFSLVSATRWAENRQEMLQLLDESGVARAQPDLVRRVERESTAHHARITTARGLVYHVLTLYSRPSPEEERQAAARLLPRARELAADALEAQPNSWQAAMILGTATYLDRSLRRDPRLYTEARAWEAPLEKAVRDARGHPEPARLLATAYLETWDNLSAQKKEAAKTLLARVFEDDLRAFEALAPAWSGLGLSTEETLSIVPGHPEAWRVLERAYAADSRWGPFRLAHESYLDALESTLEAQRQEAEERLRLGNFFRARSMILKVIVQAPPSGRFAPLVARALEIYPPGLHGLSATNRLKAWLDWARELARVGVEPLPPSAIARLLDAVGEIEPHEAAQAAQLADDLYQAERYEKLARPLSLSIWAPYLVIKADRLVELGEPDRAHEALSMVFQGARSELPYRWVRQKVARARGDLVELAIAEEQVEELRKESWTTLEWRWRYDRPVLELLASRDAAGVVVEMSKVAERGAVVEFRWDGEAVALRTIRPGQSEFLPIAVGAGPHRLELVSVAGGETIPGNVRLAD
jgi:tetratricopeptide (TPR) repeat protein